MNGDARGGYAEVNGLELYYEIHGSGEPLVLLHGVVGAIEMFGGVHGFGPGRHDSVYRSQPGMRYGSRIRQPQAKRGVRFSTTPPVPGRTASDGRGQVADLRNRLTRDKGGTDIHTGRTRRSGS